MKRFYRHVVRYPIHIYLILLVMMIFTRLSLTYFSPSGHIRMPEWNFAYETLGRDDKFSADAAFNIRKGKPGYIFGYSPVLISLIFAGTLESVGICRTSDTASCEPRMYQMAVGIAIMGLLGLLYWCIPQNRDRILALALYGTFLLGVPMNKAIEAGNIDLLASLFLGISMVLLQRVLEKKGNTVIASLCLGLTIGFLANIKAFIILFAIVPLMLNLANPVLWISFILGFIGSTLWPYMYGVHSGIFDVFFAAQGFVKDYAGGLSLHPVTQINYGNNAMFPYVSNVLSWIHSGKLAPSMHSVVTMVVGTIVAGLLYIKPLHDEGFLTKSAVLYFKKHLSVFFTFSFSLVLYTIAYMVITTLMTWSYDYRMLYSLPLLFFFIASPGNAKTKLLLHLCILFFLIKCLWIPKDRFMTLFLYIHMYYLMRTSLALWKHRQMPRRFV
jgi:hypothetical protein